MLRGRRLPGSALALVIVLKPAGAIQIGVDITALATMPPRQLNAMEAEAAALWKPYGVALAWVQGDRRQTPPGAQVMLTITRVELIGSSTSRASTDPPLGAVQFLEGRDTAEDIVAIALDAVDRTVAEAKWANRRVADWPPAVREPLLGRALGRVLAHEIGHYLLVWRVHSPEGLMRASFPGDLLVQPAREPFRLSELLHPRLRGRIAQLAPPGSTVAMIR